MKALSSILSTLGLVLTFLCATGVALAQSQGSVLKMETYRINLGEIPIGQPVEFYFDYQVEGASPILIQHVKSNRREVNIAHYTKRPSVPGDYGLVSGTVTARHAGYGNAVIFVFSNDAQSPRLALEVKWSGK
ncbi:MAG: DUF1573 domain-containing protein [Pelagimonas sp.]